MEVAHVGRGLRRIARSHGDQSQPVDSSVQCPRQLQADRAEAADRDRLPHASASAMARASARSSGVLTLRKGSHFATAKINPTHADCGGEVGDVAPAFCRQQLAQVVAAGDRPERDQMVRPPVAYGAGGRRSERSGEPSRNEWGIAGHRQQRIGAQGGGPVEPCQQARERSLAGECTVGQHRQIQRGEPRTDHHWR